MTDFMFTSPEGKKYTVTGPEGSTKEEAFQRLQRKLQGMPDLPAQPEKQEPMSWGQVGAQALVNAPSSAYKFGSDIASAVAHPIDTAKSVGGLALGGLEKGYEGYGGGQAARAVLGSISPVQNVYNVGRSLGLYGDTGHGKDVEAVGASFKDRYGGVENIKHTLAEDPVGVLGDVSMLFTGGGGLAARAPGMVGRFGRIAGEVGRTIDPINIAAKTATGAARRTGLVPGLAGRDIARALEQDKLTPASATAAGAEVARERPGMGTLANVGGENVQGLIERVAQTPGAGRTDLIPKLVAQQQGQLERLGSDLKGLTGTTKTAIKAVEDSVAEQRTAATPAYKQAYGAGDRAIWDKELERLAGAKDFRDAMSEAVGGWERTAIADGYGAMNPRAMVKNQMVQFQKGGIPAFPNLQFWDYTKHSLDRMIAAEIQPNGRLTRKGAELSTIKNKLVTVLDNAVPEYKAARAQYAGPAQYMNAVSEGKALLGRTMSAEEVGNMMRDFSEAEREGYRTGVVTALVQQMASDPAKLADYTKYLRSPAMREKIAAVMATPELADKWAKRLAFEEKSSEMVGRALKGSPTARRLLEMQNASSAGDLVKDLVATHARPSRLAMLGLDKLWPKIRDTYRGQADEKIARLLTSPGALEHLDLALKGGMARREPLLPSGAGAGARALAGELAPAASGARQAGRLQQLQSDAQERLKDKTQPLTTDQRSTLRAVARGTATLDQRQKADAFLKRFQGAGDAPPSFDQRFGSAGTTGQQYGGPQ